MRAMNLSRAQPQSIERALQTMRARYKDMSESQRRLADYMLDKPYQIAFASAAKVGGDLGISSATVVRFAEFLGLGGYADLQELARKAVAREVSEVVQFKTRSSVLNGASVLHKSLRADIESIERTGDLITELAFDKAVRLLAKARMIHVAGFRSNYGLAHQFAFNLDLVGRHARVLSPGIGDLPEQLLQMRAGDVCLAITFLRYSAQIREVLEHARTVGTPIIEITNSELSSIAEYADILLPVAVKYPSIQESRVAALSVINSLMTGIALLHPKATAESMRRHEAMWAKMNTYLAEPRSPKVAVREAAQAAPRGRRPAPKDGSTSAQRVPANRAQRFVAS